MAFVMAAVAIPIRATITRAPQVGVIEHAACIAMRAITRPEMLDMIVSQPGFTVTTEVLLLCPQSRFDWRI